MSKMHEVKTAIRAPNTELPHPQRLSNGFQSSQTNGVGDANDKNNNQEKSNKNVLKKAQKPPPPPTLPKSKRQSNGIDRDSKNRSDNSAGDPTNEAEALPLQSLSTDGSVQKSLPKTNRSTLSTVRDKGQAATHEDGATVCSAIIAVNVAETNCDTESAHSRTSHECHNGKSLLVPTTKKLHYNALHSIRPATVFYLPFLFVCEAHVIDCISVYLLEFVRADFMKFCNGRMTRNAKRVSFFVAREEEKKLAEPNHTKLFKFTAKCTIHSHRVRSRYRKL